MKTSPPLILVSNDDGIHAAGLIALATALTPLGRVVVVAPATNQSAVSHAMSLHKPLRLTQHHDLVTPHGAIEMYSVDGTPTDAVYMAAHHILLGQKPDLVVSGINHGPNLSRDIFYSGTVSAAMVGVNLGIPSVAFSLVASHTFDFQPASHFAHSFCKTLLKTPPPNGVLLNVNVPKKIRHEKYAVTTLGSHSYAPKVDRRIDPQGEPYYWIGGDWKGFIDLPGTDCNAINDGHISVTPVEFTFNNTHLLDWAKSLQA